MLFNFFKIALRNIYKKSTFSLLNILGLTLGLAAFTLLFRYVLFELSYDSFHENANQVYSFRLNNEKASGENAYYHLPAPLKNTLLDIPEISNVVRFNSIDYQNNSIIYDGKGEKKIFEQSNLYYVEPNFKSFFDFNIKEGGFSKMNEPYKIILSNETALKLFGDDNPIGKNVTLSGNIGAFDYEVVGILDKVPINSSIKFGALLSYETRKKVYGAGGEENWDSWTDVFFVKQAEQSNLAELTQKANAILEDIPSIQDREGTWEVEMTPLKDIYLQVERHPLLSKNGNLETIWILSIVGLFTLLIAYINYINLSTARAMERAREVGVRKVMGSSVYMLRIQFLSEAFLLNIIAFILGLVLVQWAIPLFQEISNPLQVTEEDKALYWILSFGLVLLGAILSGLYPAFILSSYKPVAIVKGNIDKTGKGAIFRKALVVFQYASSITLLAGALTIQKQITYMQSKDLGMNLERLIVLNAPPGSLNGDNSAFFNSVNHFKAELEAYPSIQSISATNAVPGKGINWGGFMAKQDADKMEQLLFIACDKDYAKTFGIETLAGRFYNDKDNTFGPGNVVINETGAKLLGFLNPEEAIGKKLKGGTMFPNLVIEGVMKDHHHGSLHEGIEPIAYIKSVWSNFYAIKLAPNLSGKESVQDLRQNLELIRNEWEAAFEGAPFEYSFAMDTFNAQYLSDQYFLKIINIFTLLALVIASLGLLGLSSYNMIQRRKEMGIRKVLGATANGLLMMVSKDYLILLLIAGVIATPLAWLLMDDWLNNYAFHIDLGWWLFVAPMGVIILIAFFTIILQVLKTVHANPVESLRQE